MRGMMWRLKQVHDDDAGIIVGTGTANAHVAVTKNVFATYASGITFSFRPVASNTAASTMNANSVGIKAIRKYSATGTDIALTGGEMLIGRPYLLLYDAAANSAAGAFLLLNPEKPQTRTIVTVLGAGTYTTPAGCTAILVQLQSSGGGSGYAKPNSAQAAVGGGSSAGQYSEKYIVSPAASYPYVLGAVGAAGIASTSTAATNAANSTFGSPAILTCVGGRLGVASGSTTTLGGSAVGGAQSTGVTGGDLQVNGSNGGRGIVFSATICFGGDGGGSRLGGSQKGDVSPSAGITGAGYGSGASGAANVNLSEADGAPGAPGILIVTEFYD